MEFDRVTTFAITLAKNKPDVFSKMFGDILQCEDCPIDYTKCPGLKTGVTDVNKCREAINEWFMEGSEELFLKHKTFEEYVTDEYGPEKYKEIKKVINDSLEEHNKLSAAGRSFIEGFRKGVEDTKYEYINYPDGGSGMRSTVSIECRDREEKELMKKMYEEACGNIIKANPLYNEDEPHVVSYSSCPSFKDPVSKMFSEVENELLHGKNNDKEPKGIVNFLNEYEEG